MSAAVDRESVAAVRDWLDARGAPLEMHAAALDNPGGERCISACETTLGTVIAKRYPDDSGARCHALMTALQHALARRPAAVLRLPRPLGYDAGRRVLLQECASGVGYEHLRGRADYAAALALAGRALAELHRLDADLGSPRTLRDHVAELMRPAPAELAQRLPSLRARIEALLAALDARAEPALATGPVHRDVHPRQLFLDGERVWLIDWDLCACGEAALDVGNFDMSLELKGASRAERGAFRAGYAAAQPAGSVLARVPLYRALNELRRACKQARLRGPDWAVQAERMIAAAEADIAALAARGVCA